ncbi:hypothetical protein [Pseudomonas rubra]|uniref:Uncharacterized protein n=1 Tax=Pseudomonas rubra TaxID=2942627 RepID=A0ABT5P1R0_9PSED|nr:hypothetical protein [Pseudomonas rubra]MDD1012208.1 hypothetical protein [Pseudomonas rubra]MDD1038356.1 hypothetical protein [Pseudomonas rubra]MDD1153392.1 hypothetical protein [Pseudomonas rubra]
MRYRGEKFWAWADPTLHHRYHDEVLNDGTKIDVQVRLSRTGETQLFIGVYGESGTLIAEEAYYTRPHETMSRALVWGVGRARSFAAGSISVKSIQNA